MNLIQLRRDCLSSKHDQPDIRVEHPKCLSGLQNSPVAKIHIQEGERGILLIGANNRFAFSLCNLDAITILFEPMLQYLCELCICADD